MTTAVRLVRGRLSRSSARMRRRSESGSRLNTWQRNPATADQKEITSHEKVIVKRPRIISSTFVMPFATRISNIMSQARPAVSTTSAKNTSRRSQLKGVEKRPRRLSAVAAARRIFSLSGISRLIRMTPGFCQALPSRGEEHAHVCGLVSGALQPKGQAPDSGTRQLMQHQIVNLAPCRLYIGFYRLLRMQGGEIPAPEINHETSYAFWLGRYGPGNAAPAGSRAQNLRQVIRSEELRVGETKNDMEE